MEQFIPGTRCGQIERTANLPRVKKTQHREHQRGRDGLSA